MSDNKKQLLNESTVRRFMGLAGIGALSNNFVDEKRLTEETIEIPDVPDVEDATDVEPVMTEQEEDEMPPMPGEMAEPGLEDEMPLPDEEMEMEEEGEVEDVDLSMEEAEVLISLGRKLEGELEGEEAELEGEELMPPEAEAAEAGLPPSPETAMAEALIKKLTSRVSNRIKKEYVVNEVMKRVAGLLKGATSAKRRKK